MVEAPTAPLGPGWLQVDELVIPDDETDEWEDEETEYLILDVGTNLPKEALAAQNRIQLAGLTTVSPFMRVGPRIYEGRYEELIGTEVVYADPADSADPPTLLGGTDKRISFAPVFLQAKDPQIDPSSHEFVSYQSSARGRGRGGIAAGRGRGKDANISPEASHRTRGRPRGRPRGSRARGSGRENGMASRASQTSFP